MNSIVDTSENLKDMDARIKKANEVTDELDQLQEAIKGLKRTIASKQRESKTLRKCAGYLTSEQVWKIIQC